MVNLDFAGKQVIYAHHLTVPIRPLVQNKTKSLKPEDSDNLRHDSQLILKHEIENFRVILHAFYMFRITFLENLSRKRMISNYGSRL